MLENGFVKLPRSITTRTWFGDRNTLQLYVTLLLKASFRETEFMGVRLKPGQLITSISKLTEATYLTEQQTKTALKHLKATNDITVQTSPKFSIITLNFYDYEQSDNLPDNKLDNKQGNKPNNNIRRKEKEEVIEKGNKEEREEGGASPASLPDCENSSCVISDEELEPTGFKARLIKEYGVELVTKYEEKFKAWSSARNAVNVPMYPTIAKWLAMDAPLAQTTQKAPKAPQQAPKPGKSFDTDRLRQAVMANYKR